MLRWCLFVGTYFSYLQNIHHATMQSKCVYNMDRCIVLSTVTSFLKFCRSFLVYVYIVVTYKNINFCRVISSDAHAHSCRSRSCEVLFVGRKHPNIWYPQCSSIYWTDYIYIYNSLLYYLMDIVSWNDYFTTVIDQWEIYSNREIINTWILTLQYLNPSVLHIQYCASIANSACNAMYILILFSVCLLPLTVSMF